ncbi:Fc.00g045480.m01.CDS01 [Cosmosporella sp. VM-42]
MAIPGARWALLVGIDLYLHGQRRKNEDGHTIHYPPLSGCVNDIRLVEHVLKEMGVPESHILTLTAPNRVPSQQDQVRGITREMIISAFDKLTDLAGPGDLVYVHYSGHGGRVRTVYEGLKGRNGYDEALVPSDVEITGGMYLRDVELAFLLKKMVDKGLFLTAAIDSCHSGSATRSEGVGAMTRGIGESDEAVLDTDKIDLFELSPGNGGAVSRSAAGVQSWLLDPQGYTCLSACCVLESAHEIRFMSGRVHGVFTYCLTKILRGTTDKVTHEFLYGQVCALVHSYFLNQTPVIEGDANRLFFDTGKDRQRDPIRVKRLNYEARRVILDGGYLCGVNEDEEYEVYSPDLTSHNPLARILIRESLDFESTAEIISSPISQDQVIVLGCEVVLSKSSPRKPILVRLMPSSNASAPEASTEQDRALQKIRDLAHAYPTLPWNISSSDRYAVSFLIEVNEHLEYKLRDAANCPIPNLPPFPISDNNSANVLSDCITHIAKYLRIKRLTARNLPRSSLNLTSFKLVGVAKDPTAPPKMPGLRHAAGGGRMSITCKNGMFQVSHKEYVTVLFDNPSPDTVYLTVFDLTASWAVTRIHPSGQFDEVPPGQHRALQFRMEVSKDILDRGEFQTTDHLKAVVTLRPVMALRSLELENLERAARDGNLRHEDNDLDNLLENFNMTSRVALHRTSSVGLWRTFDIVITTRCRQDEYHTGPADTDTRLSSFTTDPDELLVQYIEWYKTKAPTRQRELEKALVLLRRGCHDLGTLKVMTDSDWLEIGVEKGLGRRLSRDITEFESLTG